MLDTGSPSRDYRRRELVDGSPDRGRMLRCHGDARRARTVDGHVLVNRVTSRNGRVRLLVVVLLASGFVVAAAALARELLPLRSILGMVDDGECTPSFAYTRLPDHAASEDGHWHRAGSYPTRRDELRATGLGSRIYVGTGLTVRDGLLRSLDEFFLFDPVRGTYQPLSPVPHRVDHSAFVGHRGAIYVIGGYVDGKPTSAVWRFSSKSGRWDALAPMRVARGSPAAAAIGGRIYVVGGSRREQEAATGALSAFETYDIGTGTWSRGRDMLTPRHHHGAAAIGGRLVVVGGRNDDDLSVDAVEQFEPATGRWTSLAPLPLGVGGLAVVASGRRVIAIGGGDDEEHWLTPATWALDPTENTWHRLADLNVARHGHGAAAVGSDVYVFGGAPCPGYGRTDAVEYLQTVGITAR